jgi:hypothetical protein
VSTVKPGFGKFFDDPVRMREDPRFEEKFATIWNDMKKYDGES